MKRRLITLAFLGASLLPANTLYLLTTYTPTQVIQYGPYPDYTWFTDNYAQLVALPGVVTFGYLPCHGNGGNCVPYTWQRVSGDAINPDQAPKIPKDSVVTTGAGPFSAAVPEPGGVVGMALGMFGVAWLCKKRRK